jgi:hypothetical protein
MALTKVSNRMIDGVADVINVFDYMSQAEINDVKAGTLSIDVRNSVQAAFDAAYNAPAGTGRRVVYFPNGKYRINSTISIAGISLMGESTTGSEIYYYGINACLTNTTGQNFIKNLTFDGTNANTGSSIGIDYNTTLRHTLEECVIKNFFRGIRIRGTASFGNTYRQNYFLANSIHVYTEAIGSGQFATASYFIENEFNNASDPNYAIYLQDSEGLTFRRNVIQGNQSKYAIFVYYFSVLTNSYMNHRIFNNWFEENGNDQVGSADVYVLGSAGLVSGIVIENNQHYTTNANNPTHGVLLQSTDRIVVRGNTWNLGSPWIYLKKSSANQNWDVRNPLIVAAQELGLHCAILGKAAGSAQTVNSSANDVILFNTPLYDDSGLWNTSTGQFTCKAKGKYEFSLTIGFESSDVAQEFNLTALVNASAVSPALSMKCVKQLAGAEQFTFNGYLSCNVDDVITFKCENLGVTNRNIGVNSQAKIELVVQDL